MFTGLNGLRVPTFIIDGGFSMLRSTKGQLGNDLDVRPKDPHKEGDRRGNSWEQKPTHHCGGKGDQRENVVLPTPS